MEGIMSLNLNLLWGDDILAEDVIERARAAASAVIETGGVTIEQAHDGYDRWRLMKREDRSLARAKGKAVEIKRLHDLWIVADQTAENMLEQAVDDPMHVCCMLVFMADQEAS
jgi:hypothetical protein